jgi:hypothetical protein
MDFAGNPRDQITLTGILSGALTESAFMEPLFMHPSTARIAATSISIAWIETALRRWRARSRTVIGNAVSPVEALDGLHARMMARHQTAVRWIDLIFIERHALGILYPHPVGHAWPGQPPVTDEAADVQGVGAIDAADTEA